VYVAVPGTVREGANVEHADGVEPGRPPPPGDAVVGRDDTAASGGERPAAATTVPMADVMADMPGVWRRLLAAHVPDRLGRCRGCRSDTGSGERWPCSLYRIATEARRLHDQKLTEAIDSD
jgi:hypothetical protein